jgi:hypothetical protein
MPSLLFEEEVISNIYANTYGLYCDNAFLKGSMIATNNNNIAGINTLSSEKLQKDNKDLVFFAGN